MADIDVDGADIDGSDIDGSDVDGADIDGPNKVGGALVWLSVAGMSFHRGARGGTIWGVVL